MAEKDIRPDVALKKISKDMVNMVENVMEPGLNLLSGGWRGESAGYYLKKGYAVEVELMHISDKLQQLAETVRKIQENKKKAESNAIAIITREDV